MTGRQQFNVTLPPALVRRVKYLAIDEQLSVSHLVERLLEEHLLRREKSMAGMRLQPMIHVEELEPAVAFFEALGATLQHGSRDGDFAVLHLDGAELSLLAHPPNPEQDEGRVELNLVTDDDLPGLEGRLRDSGVDIAQSATDEGFGAQLQVRSPDGLLVKINRLEPELYT